ncbi:hypothetical protein HOLleu_38939 [Holothuria leucospilota]|uniref:Uncharacterized protein n=1 Tax=Holothuria leucospilota TaxID=206669 RepID=A0A9Q0YF25_HOLLE|nr:hypothetical protein HOLleu_38939 [Holothuria leucospilota]
MTGYLMHWINPINGNSTTVLNASYVNWIILFLKTVYFMICMKRDIPFLPASFQKR